jgi:hypothetical protein
VTIINRIEVVAVFGAMKALFDTKQYEKLGEVIEDVLLEAREKSAKRHEKKTEIED